MAGDIDDEVVPPTRGKQPPPRDSKTKAPTPGGTHG
jgi:hypothetical protein